MTDARFEDGAWRREDGRSAIDDHPSAIFDPPSSVVAARWSVVVIGYGNDLRGDDAAGTRVAAAVAGWHVAGMRVFAVRQLTPELAETLAAVRLAIFVDAYPVPDAGPRADDELRVAVRPIVPELSASPVGHTSDPCQLLALAQALYGAHPQAWLVTVPAATFSMGEALSVTAARGVSAALRQIRRLIARSESCTKSD